MPCRASEPTSKPVQPRNRIQLWECTSGPKFPKTSQLGPFDVGLLKLVSENQCPANFRSTALPPSSQRITIADVARKAGVSKATVSRFLNRRDELLTPGIATRVEAAIAALGYTPSPMAQALKRGRSRLVGLIVADVTNPFSVAVLRGAEKACQDAGYQLMLFNLGEDWQHERDAIETLASYQVEGLILNTLGRDEGAAAAGGPPGPPCRAGGPAARQHAGGFRLHRQPRGGGDGRRAPAGARLGRAPVRDRAGRGGQLARGAPGGLPRFHGCPSPGWPAAASSRPRRGPPPSRTNCGPCARVAAARRSWPATR